MRSERGFQAMSPDQKSVRKPRNPLPLFLLVLVGTFVSVERAEAQGVVTTPIGGNHEESFAVEIQPDGKIVVAGFTNNGTDDEFAVVRYNPDFSLDTSFDGDGIVTTSFGSAQDRANALAIQTDGKIVVAGFSDRGGHFDIAVARYNPDGSLDTTFDTDGMVTTDIGTNSNDEGRRVAIQSDGKIVVAGYSDMGGNYDFTVVRYNPADGSLDTTFDTDGKVTTSMSGANDRAEALAIQSNGLIVVAGNAGDVATSDIAVARYDTNGSLDPSFSGDGMVLTDIAGNQDTGRFLAIQSDGKILVAGSTVAVDYNFAVLRYGTAGALDATFDGDGIATTDFGVGHDLSYGVALQPDGKIVAAGFAHNGSNFDFAVARYNPADGSLDASFSGDGRVMTPVGSSADYGYGVAIESNGNIVVAGSSDNGTNLDIGVVRYCPGGSLVTNYSDTFGYRKAITVPSSQVADSSDLVDFPVLIHVTDGQLATTGFGGHVERSDGADIVFREGCGGAQLDHEVEMYVPNTGELIAWVKVPLLRHNLDTVIFMYYGNGGVACSTENSDGVWASYGAVWHLDEDPAGSPPQFIDSSSYKNSGTAVNSPSQAAGRIANSLQFDGTSSRHVNVSNHPSLQLSTDMTISTWVETSDCTVSNRVAVNKWGPLADKNYWLGEVNDAGVAKIEFNVDINERVKALYTLICGTGLWHHVVGVADASNNLVRLYVDGMERSTAAYDGSVGTPGNWVLQMGKSSDVAGQDWNGGIDEVRVSSVARSAGWIRTEFNNQNSPATFYNVGIEQEAPFTSPWVYGYRKRLTIDPARVTCVSDIPNVPVLISLVDPDLRTVLDGGHVRHPYGYDIVFRDSTGLTTLDSEIEEYRSDALNGTLVAWVRVPTVSTSVSTDIYMYYGNPAVSCPAQTANPTGVWDADYVGIWHLREDPSSPAPQVRDSTSNANHGTTQGAMTGGDQIPGPINGSLDLDGVDDYVAVPDANSLDIASSFTIEAWARWSSVSSNGYIVEKGGAGPFENNYYLWWNNNTAITPNTSVVAGYSTGTAFRNAIYDCTPPVTPALGQWYHVVTVFDDPANRTRIYFDGVEVVSANTNQSPGIDTGELRFGRDSKGVWGGDVWWDGALDEIRVSRIPRSVCWIETEFNNHSIPVKDAACTDNGFICVGAEEQSPPTAVSLVSLEATGYDGAVLIQWETGSELNNLGFNLYRSTTVPGPYQRVTSRPIPGLGSSPEGARYTYRDTGLANGVTYYYKLEDLETTGKAEMHGPVSATPVATTGACCGNGQGGDIGESRITVGNPSLNDLRVIAERPGEVVLELVTGGFYAEPQEDGMVKLEIPGYALTSQAGFPSLPVRQTWVEALAGRNVHLVMVEASEEEWFEGLTPWVDGGPEVVASRRGTVRLTRNRRSRGAVGVSGLFPEEAARLLSVGYQGDVKKALLELAPLRWDGTGGRLVLARRLVVRLAFRGRDRADVLEDGRVRRYRKRPSHETRQVVARLVTRERGVYGILFDEVLKARRPRGYPASDLRLSRQGEAVAFHLEPGGKWFGPGVTLLFASEGASANPYGREAVYELEVGVSGEMMRVGSAVPAGEAVEHYWQTVDKEENRFYQPALLGAPDRWLWSVLFAPAWGSYRFEASALGSTGEPSRLEVWLQGASDFDADPDHHVRLYVNGSLAGEASWDGKTPQKLEVEVPSGTLQEGENVLDVENVGDTEASYSMVMLDRFRVRYPRLPVAVDGRLEGEWSESGTVEVLELRDPAAVIEMRSSGPAWLTGVERTAAGVRFRAEAGARYLLASEGAILRAEVRRPLISRLKEKRRRADYLAIGPREFVAAAGPLLELRRGQGLRVQGVVLEEVYSEFGFGEESPEAVRDFLSYAYHHWSVSPRYVLLLGDGTYDFKDYLGTGVVNRLPPLIVNTTYLATASDPSYAAVNGEDSLPDLAIGRLPASTVEEMRRMVAKVIAFEAAARSLQGRILLVADNPDVAGDFVASAEEVASTVLSAKEVEKIYLSELGTAATRREIQRAFNEGCSLMSYIGHGGIHLWADENILNTNDTASLAPQAEQPLLLTMNCLNGYFHFPHFNALAEELLKAEDKGVVAAFSPSGLSQNDAAHVFHRALLDELFNGSHGRIGDAVLAAQSAYADSGAFPEMLVIYHLFGDPAMRIEQAR